MKTLREYIDILDEISRRDFLKGAGVAAAGAALGYNLGQQSISPVEIPQDPQIYYLIGYLSWLLLGNKTSSIEKDVTKIAQQMSIDLKSLPPNKKQVLQAAYDRGMVDGVNKKDSFRPDVYLAYDEDKTAVLWKEIDKEALPYYQKLQSLLKKAK